MSRPADDRRWMAQALALAARGAGHTSPNPMVGCIVVAEGREVGRGFHRATGRRHAEAVALAEAGARARGATLYVNLEPCAHHGRTPPCADEVVASGVARVVAAVQDPDPRVDGRGFERLRAAGIEVCCGPLADEARRLNAPFFHWHARRRPLVTLKAAVSADGRLAAAAGESRWITGEPARRFAHHLRFVHDAILVGAGTVRRDDPALDVRLPGISVARPRVVLSAGLELDPASKVLSGGPPTWIYTAATARPRFPHGEIVALEGESGEVSPEAVLDDLGRRGVQSVLVEGGAGVHGALLRRGLVDRVALFRAPSFLGSDDSTPLVRMPAVGSPAAAPRYTLRRALRLGGDLLEWGDFVAPAEES